MSEYSRVLDLLERVLDGARELRKAGVAGSVEFSRKADEIYNTLSDIEQSLRDVAMNERALVVTKAVGNLQREGKPIPPDLQAVIDVIQKWDATSKQKGPNK